MKINILRHEALPPIPADWIIENRNAREPLEYNGVVVEISRDDNYNITVSPLGDRDGLFEIIAEVDY